MVIRSPRAGYEPMPNYTLKIEENGKETETPLTIGSRVLISLDDKLHWVTLSAGLAEQGTPYRDREWLSNIYHTQNKTLKEIAELCGVSPMTINQWLVKHGIPSRSRGRRSV